MQTRASQRLYQRFAKELQFAYTPDKVGVEFEKAVIEHIDGALNVFFGDSIENRFKSKLSDKVKAEERMHLFRIENIPLSALLPMTYSFFKAKTLVKDWFDDQFDIKKYSK